MDIGALSKKILQKLVQVRNRVESIFSVTSSGGVVTIGTSSAPVVKLKQGSQISLSLNSSTKEVTIASSAASANDFVAASSTATGTHGLVPAPTIAASNTLWDDYSDIATYWLNAHGQWKQIPYATDSHGGLLTTTQYKAVDVYRKAVSIMKSTSTTLTANGWTDIFTFTIPANNTGHNLMYTISVVGEFASGTVGNLQGFRAYGGNITFATKYWTIPYAQTHLQEYVFMYEQDNGQAAKTCKIQAFARTASSLNYQYATAIPIII